MPHVIGVFRYDLSSRRPLNVRQSMQSKHIKKHFFTLLQFTTRSFDDNPRTLIHPLEFFSNARLVIFIDALVWCADRPSDARTDDEE